MTDATAMALPVQRQASLDTLMERLDDPQVAAALTNLLDHADLLAILIVGLDGMVARSETIGAALVEGIDDLKGIAGNGDGDVVASLTALSGTLPKIAPALTEAVESGLLDAILDSGLADPALVAETSRLARGLKAGAASAQTDPIPVNGLFSAMKLLKDPDIQRAVSYFAAITKSIGVELAKS